VRIVVLGATGVVGRHTASVAASRGAEVVSAARATGVDAALGTGLDEAFAGAHSVVDLTNVTTLRRGPATEFFSAVAANVQGAASRAGVSHVVVLSIVGVARCRAFGYYAAKLVHERRHLDGPLGAHVVRATQFHEFPGQLLARATAGPVAFVPALRVQTVAARSVAEVLVDAALGAPPAGHGPDVAGPGPEAALPELARAVVARRGGPRVVSLPVPGEVGRAVRAGALLPAPDALLVGPGFDDWLGGPDGPSR
jgi:uncharacterized protein YbjT (DUF2867 family)